MNVGVAGAGYCFMGGSLAFVVLVVLAWLEYRFTRKRHLLLPRRGEQLGGDAR